MFQGSITALITPFRNGGVDEKCFQDFVGWQIEEGTDALVPVGTTAGSPSLPHEDHARGAGPARGAATRRGPSTAGTAPNPPAEAISLTRHAKQAGADAALVVLPYYNKPTQEGQYRHFKAI